MNEESGTQGPYTLWINWSDQILSFRRVEEQNFQALEFFSSEERFAYIFEHCAMGFRIQ